MMHKEMCERGLNKPFFGSSARVGRSMFASLEGGTTIGIKGVLTEQTHSGGVVEWTCYSACVSSEQCPVDSIVEPAPRWATPARKGLRNTIYIYSSCCHDAQNSPIQEV